MKKITVALASLMVMFGALFAVATPVYAAKDCPAGSLQAGHAKYKTDDSDSVTAQSSMTVDSNDNRLLSGSGTVLPSVSSCNLSAQELKNGNLMGTTQIIINVILGVLGLIAVVVIIIGGVMFVTSSGDPGKVKKGKDTILYGIIGLVIALLAYAIVNFVLTSLASK
jgi:hypothetical protein